MGAKEQSRQPQQEYPAVFVASDNAGHYRELLVRGLGEQVPVTAVADSGEVVARYDGQPVILGRPDYLVELLATRPPVSWVQSTWAGVTPLVELEFRDYLLSGVKGVFGPQMAEYVFAYLLAHEIGLERRWRAQQERRWDQQQSGSLGGKVLGVMGTGSIGSHVAATALQFGMEPIGFNSRGAPVRPFTATYPHQHLHAFLERCDHLVAVLPATPATDGLLDAGALARLKKTTLLINVGRANLLDHRALVQALTQQRLAGAVLDVFDAEPLPGDSPLWQTPNLRITGHVAAVSRPDAIAALFIANYGRFQRGEMPGGLVDFSRGY